MSPAEARKINSSHLIFTAFIGDDCNALDDFCEEDEYNAKCAPDACVPIFGAFYCSECRDETKKGFHCTRGEQNKTSRNQTYVQTKNGSGDAGI